MSRIGLLGGTFDPPHIGHLILAETARQQLQLDQVLFLPAGEPPHKVKRQKTAVAHRVAMTALALKDNAAFALDLSDVERPLPHYTVTLVSLLQQQRPEANFWLLLGSDSLRDLAGWYQPAQLIRQCRLAVLPRSDGLVDWVTLSLAVPGVDAAVDSLAGPAVALSSTELRQWAAKGQSLRYLTPTAVITYIHENQLYG
jgi:nicotinate-nucleotide adenylyltransferase